MMKRLGQRHVRYLIRSSLVLLLLLTSPCFGATQDLPTLGLPALPAATDNPLSARQISLGKTLFQDKRLSADGTVSCASCHQPGQAFADGLALARGVGRRLGTRNTPSIINAAFLATQFWDGRRDTLEAQVQDPLLNPTEHGLRNAAQLVDIVRRDPHYRTRFRQAFGRANGSITVENVARAIAAFERTLIAGDSPFDRHAYGHDQAALSEAAGRGLTLFRGRAKCESCHQIGPTSAMLTDNRFHSLGVGFKKIEPRLAEMTLALARSGGHNIDHAILSQADIAELGRFVVTHDPADIGRFKTPSLRNVALTAPYMHDGSVATLAEAVDLEVYYRGIAANRPLVLTPQEKADLVEFLKALTSARTAELGGLRH